VSGSLPELFRWSDLLAGFSLPRISPAGLMLGRRQGCQMHLLTAAGMDSVIAARVLPAEFCASMRKCGHRKGLPVSPCTSTTADARAAVAAGAALPVLLDLNAWLDLPAGG